MAHHRLLVVLGLVATFSVCTSTVGRAGELFLDPWKAPGLVRRIEADPAGALRGFSRVHLLVFSNAQALYPTRAEPFAQAPAFRGSDMLRRLGVACAKAKVPVSWAVDLLRWERGDVPSSSVFERLPEWEEVGVRGSKRKGDGSRFASPYHAGVRKAICSLLDEIVGLEPFPEGLALSCRLSLYDTLGYSTASRAAYILAASLDPADLTTNEELTQWANWRVDETTRLMRDLVSKAKKARPKVQILAWGTGNYVIRSPQLRGQTTDDCLAWLGERLVADVVLDCQWDAFWNARIWPAVRTVAARVAGEKPAQPDEPPVTGVALAAPVDARKRVSRPDGAGPPTGEGHWDAKAFAGRVHSLVHTRDAAGEPCLAKNLEALLKQKAPMGQVVLYPMSEEDWESMVGGTAGGASQAPPPAQKGP